MQKTFIDLDELIIRCRDKISRNFIQEAVLCYRAGAFRSCIVATWNAVVFDFLHKLRELELLGDKQAEELLENFENLRESENYKGSWQFEASIPEFALTKFELISTVEKSDIERLFDDRSRCAHPSMTSLDEPFEATAELARYHLRNAVSNLLEHPPVQGRAALKRIEKDIESEYFPSELELAIQYLKKSLLERARPALINSIVIVLTKSLLLGDYSDEKRTRQLLALNAISCLYHQQTREILNEKLSGIILRVEDENWNKVIEYLGSITSWDVLTEPCKLKAEAFIRKIEILETKRKYSKRLSSRALDVLVKASHVEFLRESIVRKLHISLKYILPLIETCKDDVFIDRILKPVLQEMLSEATLDELLEINSKIYFESDTIFLDNLKKSIQDSSLKKLSSLIYAQQEDWLTTLIEPVLKEKIPGNKTTNLLYARSRYGSLDDPNSELVGLFESEISKKVTEEKEALNLEDIISFLRYYEEPFVANLLEPYLVGLVSTSDLNTLLKTRKEYKFLDEPKSEILDLFEKSIKIQIESISFDDFHDQVTCWDEIEDEILKPFLRKNKSLIIHKYLNSGSFDSAGDNTDLLVKIVEYFEQNEWKTILEGFFSNDQLYCSYRCHRAFENLYIKSLELHDDLEPLWLTFLKQIEEFNSRSALSLKDLIDSHLSF